MKRIYLFAVVVTVSFALLQSAEAYPRGSSRSFVSPPHFSAPSYHSAPSRSFSSAAARYSASPRFQNRTYAQTAPRISSAMALRNSVYLNRARFSGDRTAAFNSRGFSPSTARLAAGNFIVNGGIALARAEAFRAIGGFDVSLRYCEDWHCWCRLAAIGELVEESRRHLRSSGVVHAREEDGLHTRACGCGTTTSPARAGSACRYADATGTGMRPRGVQGGLPVPVELEGESLREEATGHAWAGGSSCVGARPRAHRACRR